MRETERERDTKNKMVWDEHSVPITQKDSVLVNLNETPLPLHELIIVGVHNTAEEQGINRYVDHFFHIYICMYVCMYVCMYAFKFE